MYDLKHSPPFQRGGLVNSTIFLYLHQNSGTQSDWLIWNYPVLGFLTASCFIHHNFTDLLSKPPICWSSASDFKGLSLWCEDYYWCLWTWDYFVLIVQCQLSGDNSINCKVILLSDTLNEMCTVYCFSFRELKSIVKLPDPLSWVQD